MPAKKDSWEHIDVLIVDSDPEASVALDMEGKILAEYRGKCSGIELFEKWYQEIWQRVAAGIGST